MKLEVTLSPVLAARDQDLVLRKVAGNSPFEIFGRHTRLIGHGVLMAVLLSFAIQFWLSPPSAISDLDPISIGILIFCLISLPGALGGLSRWVRTGFVTDLPVEPRIEGFNAGLVTVTLTPEAMTMEAPIWRSRLGRPVVTAAYLRDQSVLLAGGANHLVTLPATPQVLSFLRVSWDMDLRRA